MAPENYKTTTYWKGYQAFFPADAQIAAGDGPDEEWFSWQGASIHLDRFPADAPLTVIIVHGGGGYGRMFAPLGRSLQRAGHEVVAPDLPGYGLSRATGAMADYGVWVDLVCDIARAEFRRNGRRIVFFGGSLGGYLAYLCAARLGKGLVAGVVATTLADPRTPLVRRQFARNAFVLRVLMPLMPFFAAVAGRLKLPVKWFTKMDAMSNDAGLNKLVAADPCGGGAWVPVRFMQSIFTVAPDIEPESFDICPVLLAHPANDRWTGVASSRSFFERIKGNKQLIMLENCGHFPVEQPGIAQLEQAVLRFLAGLER